MMLARSAVIALTLTTTPLVLAQSRGGHSGTPEMVDANPESFLDRVDPEQRVFLRRMTPYYARLPNGRCVSIFREVHLWHAENNVTGLPAIVKAESFDYPLEDEPDSSVRHEFAGEAPPPTTHGVDYLFASGLKHGSRLRIIDARDPDRMEAVIMNGGSGAPSSFHVTGIPESRRSSVEIWRPVFLYREEPNDGSNRPVYRFIDALDNRPTAGELAMAIAEGKTELVTYRVSRSEHQKKKQRGKIWKTKVSDGPLVVTHTWERRPITVRFRDVTDPIREEPSRSEPEPDLPETRDLIRLADGREFRGRFVYQDVDHIVFEIAVGRARGKMTFPRDEVVEVVRSNDDSGEGDVDE